VSARRGGLEPFLVSVVVLVVLGLAGFASFALAWKGTADIVRVDEQVGYLVSGGIGGLALVTVALGLLTIQHRRRVEARQRAEFQRVLRAASALLAAVADAERGRR
jgi:hypothetical protein